LSLAGYKYNPPAIVKFLFNDFTWNTSNDKVLLTFDDGPNPGTTENILQKLSDYKIKAAFFCTGNNIKQNPELAKQIKDEGHQICNHTFNHLILTKVSAAEIENEIRLFDDTLNSVLGIETKFFRPPYGRFNFRVRKNLNAINLKTIMWSLITYDFKNDYSIVKKSLDKYLRSNSIIVLHDNNKSKNIIEDSIDYIVEKVNEKDFRFGEPLECLK
jgi:peptidoglycan-N-acetylglucosamine deacetylase